MLAGRADCMMSPASLESSPLVLRFVGYFYSMLCDNSFDQDISGWDTVQATDFMGMFETTPMSIAHYDALLIQWSQNPNTPDNMTFDDPPGGYSSAAARQALVDKDWVITDGGQQ